MTANDSSKDPSVFGKGAPIPSAPPSSDYRLIELECRGTVEGARWLGVSATGQVILLPTGGTPSAQWHEYDLGNQVSGFSSVGATDSKRWLHGSGGTRRAFLSADDPRQTRHDIAAAKWKRVPDSSSGLYLIECQDKNSRRRWLDGVTASAKVRLVENPQALTGTKWRIAGISEAHSSPQGSERYGQRQRVAAKYVFLDVVAFTRPDRKCEHQVAIIDAVNRIVKASLFDLQLPDDDDRLHLLPTGDGVCIGLTDYPNPPDIHLQIALRILHHLTEHNNKTNDPAVRIALAIGVNQNEPDIIVVDINGRENLAGRGINIAQRIMSAAGPNQIILGDTTYASLIQSVQYKESMFRKFQKQVKHGQILTMYQYVNDASSGLDCTELPDDSATSANELQSGTSGLTEVQRSIVIRQLYLLKKAHHALSSYVAEFESEGAPSKEQKAADLESWLQRFAEYADSQLILLPKEIEQEFISHAKEIRDCAGKYAVGREALMRGGRASDGWHDLADYARESIGKRIEAWRERMRSVLGVPCAGTTHEAERDMLRISMRRVGNTHDSLVIENGTDGQVRNVQVLIDGRSLQTHPILMDDLPENLTINAHSETSIMVTTSAEHRPPFVTELRWHDDRGRERKSFSTMDLDW